MIAEEDGYGKYATCMTCGHVREEIGEDAMMLLASDELTNEGNRRQRRRQPSHGKIKL